MHFYSKEFGEDYYLIPRLEEVEVSTIQAFALFFFQPIDRWLHAFLEFLANLIFNRGEGKEEH